MGPATMPARAWGSSLARQGRPLLSHKVHELERDCVREGSAPLPAYVQRDVVERAKLPWRAASRVPSRGRRLLSSQPGVAQELIERVGGVGVGLLRGWRFNGVGVAADGVRDVVQHA